MATKTAELHHHILWGYAGNSAFWLTLIRTLPNLQWHEAGLHPCINTLCNLLLPLLSYTFRPSEDEVYLHTKPFSKFFNLAHLRANIELHQVSIWEMLFTDNATMTSHCQAGLQRLLNCLVNACHDLGLIISLKKVEIMAKDVSKSPSINIGEYMLTVIEDFTYLTLTVFNNLSLDSELDKWIGRAIAAMAKLHKRVWENNKFTTTTKITVYRDWVLYTFLYGSESQMM